MGTFGDLWGPLGTHCAQRISVSHDGVHGLGFKSQGLPRHLGVALERPRSLKETIGLSAWRIPQGSLAGHAAGLDVAACREGVGVLAGLVRHISWHVVRTICELLGLNVQSSRSTVC